MFELLQFELMVGCLLVSHLAAPIDEDLKDGPALVIDQFAEILVVLKHIP